MKLTKKEASKKYYQENKEARKKYNQENKKPLKRKGNPLNHLYDTTPIKKQIPIW